MYWSSGMREVAARTRASKETLYSWFGDKRGLFEELVAWQAEGVDEALGSSLERDTGDTGSVLREFAVELIRLLLGERSAVINRAAISEAPADATFARLLSAKGSGSIVPKLARYLESPRERGHLEFADAGAADTLIDLIIGDQQVRRLLGVLLAAESAQIEARADQAVRSFLALFASRPAQTGYVR